MFVSRKTCATRVLALALALACSTALAKEFSFALWGDIPYASNGDDSKVQALIADINAAKVAFSIFDGGIKDDASRCENLQYLNAVERFNTFKKPMMYVPGANEWTDCHLKSNGGYSALERLDHLRWLLFSKGYSFGKQPIKLEQQYSYLENTRWTKENVVFVGLNVTGSNNNWIKEGECLSSDSDRTLEDCILSNNEYAAREAATVQFLRASFQKAKDNRARGVFITIQADPGFDLPETEDVNERNLPGYDGYNTFMAALAEEAVSFNGEVVLAHGGVRFFKVDKPLIDQAHLIKNFTRLATFGSPNAHWVKVTVHPKDRNLFTFEPMILQGN